MTRRKRHHLELPAVYVLAAILGALGGARPTGLEVFDPLLLGGTGVAMAVAAREARSLPLYVACAMAAILQPASIGAALGVAGMLAVLVRKERWAGSSFAAAAGGLFWAAAVGFPLHSGGHPQVVPLLAAVLVFVSARRHGRYDFKLWFDRTVFGLGTLVAVIVALSALSILGAKNHIERSVDLLRSGLEAARSGDTATAVENLQSARRVLERGDKSLGAPWAQGSLLVPGLSQNFRALSTTVDEVIDLSTVAIEASRRADVDTLRVSGGRLDLAAVARMGTPLEAVLSQLEATDGALDDVEDQWLVPYVRDRLRELHTEIRDGMAPARLALRATRTVPAMLGSDGPRTYLVLFTTPVESRATTGFPGNFGIVRFTDGRFDMIDYGRSADLNDRLPDEGPALQGLDEYLARYDRFGPRSNWQNVPVSPDFPTVAAVARQLVAASRELPPIDGVMSVDPAGLAALLNLTGPIDLPGLSQPLGPDNATRYLELDQYVELSGTTKGNEQRIDALEQLATVAVDRLASADLPGPRELGDLIGPAVQDGHIQMVTFSADEMPLLDALGLSGRYPAVRGDFLGVTTSNSGGGKQDVFLRRELGYDVQWDSESGSIESVVTVTLHNDSPSSDLPEYLIGNGQGGRLGAPDIPPGGNYTFLTVYTPWDVVDATLDGEPIQMESLPELGRKAHSTFILIPPGGSRTLAVRLSGVSRPGRYRLDLGRQPLVTPEQAHIAVDATGSGSLRTRGPIEVHGNAVEGRFTLERPTEVVVTTR